MLEIRMRKQTEKDRMDESTGTCAYHRKMINHHAKGLAEAAKREAKGKKRRMKKEAM